MVLTLKFSETVKARAERDSAFREALLAEAIDQLLAGDLLQSMAISDLLAEQTSSFSARPREGGDPD